MIVTKFPFNKPKLSDNTWYPTIPSLCECDDPNCRELVYGGKRFIQGHNTKTKEGRKMFSDVNLSKISYLKGKSALCHIGNKYALKKPNEFKKRNCGNHKAWNKGKSSWSKNKHFSESHKKKIADSLKGSNNGNWKGGEKICGERHYIRTKNLGWHSLNPCIGNGNQIIKGYERHHVNKNDVIYVPKHYNQDIIHNLHTGYHMEIVNTMAYFFLIMNYIEDLNKLFKKE